MRFTDAIRWGLYDRLLATLSFVAGLALAVGGLWIGTSEWFVDALSGDAGATPGGVDAAIALGGVLLGLLVWQVGSAAARHRTMVTATKNEVGGREAAVDDVAPSDEADRLAQLESDVEEVRRVAARIEQSMRTSQYEADGLDGGSAGADGGAGATASGSSAAGAAAGASADTSTTEADETASEAEPAAPEIEFSDEPDDEGSADAGATTADDTEAVGDGGAVADADVDDGAVGDTDVDDGAVDDADDTATDDGAGSDDAAADGASADDGFEWPEEEEEEYYRNT